MNQTDQKSTIRVHIYVRGIVQGVGFRPFVFNLAKNCSLYGYVLNDTRGVDIEVEGSRENVENFLHTLRTKPPPLAIIEEIKSRKLPPTGYRKFQIKSSRRKEESFLPISPDIGTCNDCVTELFNPEDRRYLYPFINCTNCGPRFSIIKDIPYDRKNTTMSSFNMCEDCDAEYHDPSNRRFHAQPNACWRCGPRVRLMSREDTRIKVNDPIFTAADFLKEGNILAVKGIGGYHLACDATKQEVVKKLREKKNRIDKPFALMMLDIKQVKNFCHVDSNEEHLLLSPRRPIVLLRKREDKNILPEEIAPGNRYLGVMLPYTPLHYILLNRVDSPLVMTSGNISEEPIAFKDEDAMHKLDRIADFFLVHNRSIEIRVDDSVARVVEGEPMLIRRSRGYAPQPVKVGVRTGKCILAAGGHLKNTFCFLKKDSAIVSHHIGDLENLAALSALEEGVEHYKRIFHCTPEAVACDLHPNYLSTGFAREYSKKNSIPLIPVQHHHAHIASLLAERDIKGEVIGVCFDGSGLGTDNTLWGGEFLIADLSGFDRRVHFRYVPLPGGEAAIKEPWRMAISYLNGIYKDEATRIACQLFSSNVELKKIFAVQNMIKRKINTPLICSVGRLFDAIAALLGVRMKVNYEGQAAVELEMLAEGKIEDYYPFEILEKDQCPFIDTFPLVASIVNELMKGEKKQVIATKFHWSISRIILQVSRFLRERSGLRKVALSGGVFQNSLLLHQTSNLLISDGFEVFYHRLVPPNDGGISLGQAAVACTRLQNR